MSKRIYVVMERWATGEPETGRPSIAYMNRGRADADAARRGESGHGVLYEVVEVALVAEDTCHIQMPIIDWETGDRDCVCSACGASIDPQDLAEADGHCPNRWARVIDDKEES